MVDMRERAVRRYLVFLANPQASVDDDLVSGKIAQLEKEFASTDDPIDKLRLRSSIERVRRPDREALEDDFVANAFEWALANNIVPGAFRSMGVDPELLQRAGLGDGDAALTPKRGLGQRTRTSGRQTSTDRLSNEISKQPSLKRQNRPPVRVDEIFPAIRKQSKRFTISQIHHLAGGSIGSARTAVLSLVASGEVRAVGTKSGARGKAPMQYEVNKRKS